MSDDYQPKRALWIPPDSKWSSIKRFLGLSVWTGIAALATIVGVLVAVALDSETSNTPSSVISGDCNALGEGNTVSC
jgi:hypothetical protein